MWSRTMFTHVVIILWIFLKGRLLNARSACLPHYRASTEAAPPQKVRFRFDCCSSVDRKQNRSNIYCLDCHGLQHQPRLRILLIIAGIKPALEMASCPDVCRCVWINKCDKNLAQASSHLCLCSLPHTHRCYYLLSGPLSQLLCHTVHIFLEGELCGALIAARECVELGHFNMAAVQQRTVLLGPARQYWCQMSERTERERRGETDLAT